MTVKEALLRAGTASRDAERLLAHLLQLPPASVFAHPEHVLPEPTEQRFIDGILRLSKGEPLEYVTGEAVFCGRMFAVDRRVLIPRPATEMLTLETLRIVAAQKAVVPTVVDVEEGIAAVFWKRRKEPTTTVLDVCTGSGCIGITIALERPDVTVLCSDASPEAVAIAEENVRRFSCGDRVCVCEAEGLPTSRISAPYFLVANPPYIPDDAWVQDSVRAWEPSMALFSGLQGTDVLLPLARTAVLDPLCQGIALECRGEQVRDILPLFP